MVFFEILNFKSQYLKAISDAQKDLNITDTIMH